MFRFNPPLERLSRAKWSMVDLPEKPSSNIAVLHKALDLLEALQAADKPRSLDQLVAATGLARSTAHRLLLNLVSRGYVERAGANTFALGLKLLELGATVRQRQSLRDIALPFMLNLRNELGETVNLGRVREGSVLYLETVESEHAFRVSASLGIRDPLHVTAIGKAILAWLPPERRPVLADWRKLTPSTITDPKKFDRELLLTRERGYALDEEESMEGGRCIGVPILHLGSPVAGLSVSGPIARITTKRIKGIAATLQSAAAAISQQIRLLPSSEWA